MDMHIESRPKVGKKAGGRSRVTNGSKLGADMDGRSVWARRLSDLIELYSSDVGPAESISQMKRSLIRRAACLTVELERAEAGFARLGQADADALNAYQTTANSLRRLIESLSIKASVKDADEVQRTIEGQRVVNAHTEKWNLSMYAVCTGMDQAKIDAARRVALEVEKARETGQPVPSKVAKLAVELALADYQSERPEDDIARLAVSMALNPEDNDAGKLLMQAALNLITTKYPAPQEDLQQDNVEQDSKGLL